LRLTTTDVERVTPPEILTVTRTHTQRDLERAAAAAHPTVSECTELTTASIPAHRIAPLHRSATVRISATRVRTGDAPTSNTAETKHRVKRFFTFSSFLSFFERVYFLNNKEVQKKQKNSKT